MAETRTKVRGGPRRPGSGSAEEPSDAQLLGRFNGAGDAAAEAAFAALVRRHGPMVLRVCGQVLGDRHAAEDAFQASFLVLARRSGSIRRPELLGNWLYGVALRTAREAKLRDGRRRRFEATPAAEPPAAPGARPDLALIDREDRETLHEEVARLPERYRAPLVLCELEGMTYGEAARRLGCPVGTVGVRLVRARERLRVRLIRRGVAPASATALVGTLFGAGEAGTIAAGLVEATAGAAIRFAVGDAAAGGLVPAATAALAATILGALKLAAVKATAGALLAVGLVATVATFGGLGTAPRPAPAGRVTATPGAAAGLAARPAPPVPPVLAAAVPAPPLGAAAAGDGGASVVPLGAAGRAGPAPVAIPNLIGVGQPGRAEVVRGEALFLKEWVAHDPFSPDGDGLGPVFNATSCVACHGLGAPGGAGPENRNVVLVTASATSGTRLDRATLAKVHPGFGAARSVVVHRYGVDSSYGPWRRSFFQGAGQKPAQPGPDPAEETVDQRIRRFAEQARPNAGTGGPQRGAQLGGVAGVNLRVSERNSPALFGAGQIDSVTAEVLVDEAAAQPIGLRGKVSRMSDGRVGRFGWKGQIAGLHEFVRSACASELGLEVPGHAQGVSPLDPSARGPGLDLTEGDCDALVAYVRALPAPVAVDPDGPHGNPAMAEGRRLFDRVGCATCHAPSLGPVRGIYSDLLLHEVGLNDSGSYYGEVIESPGSAGPGEWRTPPLWGYRDSGPYLHDGRAETLEEAVALHAGQAGGSAREFFALAAPERAAVETFLKSLVAPSAASAPGVVLAAELEARVVPPEARRAEAQTRRDRQDAEARQVQERVDARRHEEAEAAARRAERNFQLGANLDRIGKVNGALRFYNEAVREAPDTREGRTAADRIAALLKRARTP